MNQRKEKIYTDKYGFVSYAFRHTLNNDKLRRLVEINDDESLSYMTVFGTALKISKWIVGLMRTYGIRNNSIIDATAGIGGNVIAFAGHHFFKYIYAVEIDTSRYGKLIQNIKICCEPGKCLSTYNADFLHWYDIKKYKGIPVFIDPPWGGEEYNKQSSIDFLYLYKSSGTALIEIVDLVEMLLKYSCSLVAVKLPLNFRISRFKICKEFAMQLSFIYFNMRVEAFVLKKKNTFLT